MIIKNNAKPLKILFAVWELEPFLKVGGLGEVARTLPHVLKTLGIDIRVIIPNYKALKTFRQKKKLLIKMRIQYGSKRIPITIHQIKFLNADIPVYLLGSSPYLDTPNQDTFSLFAASIVKAVEDGHLSSWTPDIIHCNEYHCGLIPLLIKLKKLPIKTLLTIHSIHNQGHFSPQIAEKIGIPRKKLSLMYWETKKRKLNFLLEGIVYADRINTVSPTYLKEIQTEQVGAGLDDIIKKYRKKISAILNGIDYVLKNPATNINLSVKYSVFLDDRIEDSSIAEYEIGKRENKLAIQEKLGLNIDETSTLIGFIGRFDAKQKGIELVHRMIIRNHLHNSQFIIMGQGEKVWEERFLNLGIFHPKQIAVVTQYNDILASQIYAGCDLIMIPSHFEPCCLVQMNAMRYGALPIARVTGGLNDTIVDGKNGFLFRNSTGQALENSIKRAIRMKRMSPKKNNSMIINAMQTDFSWLESAKKYIALYQDLLNS